MGDNSDVKQAAILIVDDEPVNVRLLEKLLAAEGYSGVISTTDPRTVFDLCATVRFDLILLDINMPHLDGYAVMAGLRSAYREEVPPILVLTAQHAQDFKLRALESGARDYLTKPFDRIELSMRVRNLLEVQLYHRAVRARKELLEQEVHERTRELQETRLEVVRRLGRAAEYRDNETGLHIIRMSRICESLGRRVGLPSEECDLLLNAAPMHDIGKIGIPDDILKKPAKLTPEEFTVMKSHTTIGGELLSGNDTDLIRTARVIALTHHEKWDGSGYPLGLAGEAIPLHGRITAIADVFDALTSVRPYKRAWTVDAALEYITQNAGSHFDPALVPAFLSIREEVEAIRHEHADPVLEEGIIPISP